MSIELDHLLWAAPDLDQGSALIAKVTGVAPGKGGSHPGFGTRNSLLSLGDTYLEVIAPAVSLGGLVLGLTRDRRWLALPTVVLAFLVQHAVQGWCPPLGFLRRGGVRTRREIDEERYALKALRGDFAGLPPDAPQNRVTRIDAVLSAVRS